MDKNLSKLHRGVKNLSPINKGDEKRKILFKKEKELEHQEQKQGKLLKESSSKTNVKETVVKGENKEGSKEKHNSDHKNLKSEEFKYGKNINEYRHIMCDTHSCDSQMAWVLELRGYNKKKYRGLKELHDQNPRFYSDEIAKFKKRMGEDRDVDTKNLTSRENLNTFTHLFKKRLGGTANNSQYAFETTLRNFHPGKEEVNPEWKGASFIHKPRLFSSYFPSANKWETTNKFFTMNNFSNTLKAYNTVYDVFFNLFIFLGSICGH